MGNRTGVKKQHRTRPIAPLAVDATEVDAADGCLTLRCAPVRPGAAPVRAALPYPVAAGLPDRLEELADRAEHDYWPLIAQLQQRLLGSDPQAWGLALERHVRTQDWTAALAAAPLGDLRLFRHGGHIAVLVQAPYTGKPALLVFDPLQLRRLADTVRDAVDRAHRQYQSEPERTDTDRVAAALAALTRAPWPPLHQPVTPEHAEQVMQNLHEEFLARVPYQRPSAPTAAAPPADTAWTPLLHPCGCTVDWGWDKHETHPDAFIQFCLRNHTAPCPWHTDTLTPTPTGPAGVMPVLCPASGAGFWARKAGLADLTLGAELTRQLVELTRAVVEADPEVFTATLPAQWCRSVTTMGDDPLRAYLEQRLLDILLNRGADTMARLTALASALDARSDATEDGCGTCTATRALGGIICVCGHDWSCHPGPVGRSEPCSHCSCPDMRTESDPEPR